MRGDDEEAGPTSGPAGRPYGGYDGPLGFSSQGGGYPVEPDDEPDQLVWPDEATAGDGGQEQAPDDAGASAGPRRLYNPLPPAQETTWYGPEPARTDWRRTAAMGSVLVAAVALGLWLAWPSAAPSPEPHADSPIASSPSAQPRRETVFTPSARRARTPLATRSPRSTRSPGPVRTFSPRLTPRSSVSARPSRTSTPLPRRIPSTAASARATVTVTRRVPVEVTVRSRVTVRATPSARGRHGGPEEPPGRG